MLPIGHPGQLSSNPSLFPIPSQISFCHSITSERTATYSITASNTVAPLSSITASVGRLDTSAGKSTYPERKSSVRSALLWCGLPCLAWRAIRHVSSSPLRDPFVINYLSKLQLRAPLRLDPCPLAPMFSLGPISPASCFRNFVSVYYLLRVRLRTLSPSAHKVDGARMSCSMLTGAASRTSVIDKCIEQCHM